MLVSPSAIPPSAIAEMEDWAWRDARTEEIALRLETLEARVRSAAGSSASVGSAGVLDRQRLTVDASDVIHVGSSWVSLGPTQARLARVLLASEGAVVSRAAVEQAVWDDAPVRSNTIDRLIHRTRSSLRPLGLMIRTVRGQGYVLDRVRTPVAA
jgi:DNA-binding response OmpR family regulator